MNELQNFEYLKIQYEEELHDVFSTVLDTFPNIYSPVVSGQTYLWDVLQNIKYNLIHDIGVNTFLTHKYINGERNTVYDELKAQLPVICYNACFDSYKSKCNLKSITNLMFLDIDDFKCKEDALAYKTNIINKYDWILACNLSLSKLGLHVIILVEKIIDNDDYNLKYEYISSTYFNGRLDKSSKSLTRYTVVPSDYNIYINYYPNVLDIENIIQNRNKSIRSGYIQDVGINRLPNNKKGICSSYIEDESACSLSNNQKGICCVGEEEIICTAYTFSPTSSVKEIMNDAARKYELKFRYEVDESLITEPDKPYYAYDGIDVININLFPYRDKGVKVGSRNKFIGAIAVQMIYLNAVSSEKNMSEIKKAILKFMLSINKQICDPPMKFKEVLNSFNSNWKKYEAGELDFSMHFKKQRAFWSKNTTLKGNEKRKVTCKIKNEPIIANSKRKIKEAVDTLKAQGEKITQKKVANISGIKLPTVKKYGDYYNELMNRGKKNLKQDCAAPDSITKPDNHILFDANDTTELNLPAQNSFNSNTSSESTHYMEIKNAEIIDCYENTLVMFDELEFKITDEQIREVYDRIFSSIKRRLDENQEQKLYAKFLEQLNNFTNENVKLLAINIDDINDSTTYFKQSTLDGKLMDLCNVIFQEDVK